MKKTITILLFFYIALFVQAQPFAGEKLTMPDSMLNTYLLNKMHQHYAHRRAVLAKALQNTAQFEQYQQQTKQKYRKLLGDFPDSLKRMIPVAEMRGIVEQDGYQIERLILNQKIPVNLYLPDGNEPKPAILFFCGHEQTGKSTDSYQRTAHLFAKNGFVVLVADPISQGERVQLLSTQGKAMAGRATSEHTLLNASANLAGWGMIQEELADNFLCMNYLRSLNEVDSTHIGSLGNSGGGAQNTFFAALEDRIQATACCSFFTQRERMLQKFGADDGCQNLTGETSAELELVDYYLTQVPRPTLILAGKQDFMDFEGAKQAFVELQNAYSLLNEKNNVEMLAVNDGHGISQAKREKAVQFFCKHLLDEDREIRETDFTPLADSLLRCTRSGQIALDYPEKFTSPEEIRRRGKFTFHFSPKQLTVKTQKRELNFEPTADMFRDRSEAWTAFRRMMNIPDTLPPVRYQKIATDTMQTTKDILAETFIISRESEPDMKAILLLPAKKRNIKSVEIVVSHRQEKDFNPFDYGLYVNKNRAVLIAFVRNEIAPLRNNKKFYNDDYRVAALSLMLGKPLVGQQLIDECSAADFACTVLDIKHKDIVNVNQLWRIYSLYENWNGILKKPLQKNKLNSVVPGILQ